MSQVHITNTMSYKLMKKIRTHFSSSNQSNSRMQAQLPPSVRSLKCKKWHLSWNDSSTRNYMFYEISAKNV